MAEGDEAIVVVTEAKAEEASVAIWQTQGSISWWTHETVSKVVAAVVVAYQRHV